MPIDKEKKKKRDQKECLEKSERKLLFVTTKKLNMFAARNSSPVHLGFSTEEVAAYQVGDEIM